MAFSLADKWASYRWIMQEKGLQKYWNEIQQIMNSVLGSTLTAGTTSVGAIDIETEDGGGLKSVSTLRSGSFSTSNAGASGSSQVPLPDPAGTTGANNVPPTTPRLSFKTPTAGFRS